MSGQLPLRWEPSPAARSLRLLAATALLAFLATQRVELLAIATPTLWLLASAARSSRPTTVSVAASVDLPRCFEGDRVTTTVTCRADVPVDALHATVTLAPPMRGPVPPQVTATRTDTVAWTSDVVPARWGRYPLGTVALDVRATGGFSLATVTAELPVELVVFPHPEPLHDAVALRGLPDRTGDHAGRAVGAGVEFAAVRPFAFGDSARRVNWAVSTRRRRLHVNEFAAERSADVVLVLDALSDVGPAGRSSLDLSVRAATGAAQRYLRARDRVGVVAIGGRIRWLAPALGRVQFYRVVESVLRVRRDASYVDPDLGRVPPVALPAGALVIFFSPLLDQRAVEVIRDARERRFVVVVVDVLDVEPPVRRGDRDDALALRVWRLDRRSLVYRLARLGVPVVPYAEPAGLAQRLHVALRQFSYEGAAR